MTRSAPVQRGSSGLWSKPGPVPHHCGGWDQRPGTPPAGGTQILAGSAACASHGQHATSSIAPKDQGLRDIDSSYGLITRYTLSAGAIVPSVTGKVAGRAL